MESRSELVPWEDFCITTFHGNGACIELREDGEHAMTLRTVSMSKKMSRRMSKSKSISISIGISIR